MAVSKRQYYQLSYGVLLLYYAVRVTGPAYRLVWPGDYE
jgi:hypothetical protein